MEIVGYHGTSSLNSSLILEQGFKESCGDCHWLGDGVYFFLAGRDDDPCGQAASWADLQSFDKKKKIYTYDTYDVLKAKVSPNDDYVLDLNDSSTSKNFSEIAKEFCRVVMRSKRSKMRNFSDGVVINWMRKELDQRIDVAIGDLYIKLDFESRLFHFERRTPNSTVAAVHLVSCISGVSVELKDKEVTKND